MGDQHRQIAEVYRATFAARTDAYADWDDRDPDRAKHHWTAVRSELTTERVMEALTGPRPLSTYMETPSGETHLAAYDFDREDGWTVGLRIAATITAAGGAPILEESRRGGHLWLVLDDLVFGGEARLALREWARLTDVAYVRDPKVEILPKRLEQRDADSLGSPLRMPMMAHQKTGKRYRLLDGTGQPLGKSISAILAAIPLTSAALVRKVASSAKVPTSEVHIPDWARRAPQPGGDIVQILTAAGVARVIPGRATRCPLHDDRIASLSISRDGERAWCKAPECIAYNYGRGFGADQMAEALAVRG